MNNPIQLKNHLIGDNQPTYIIAEMSANHGGNFDKAIEIIKEAKKAGADCIKIQTYTADTITIDCNKGLFHIDDGIWKGENLYRLYQKAYTPWEWQADLKKEAEKIGLDFLSSVFDKTAVDFLEKLNVEFYKIASFEAIDIPLIKYVASKGKPIIISVGMASLGEIEEAVNTVKNENNNNLCLLKCQSAYPANPEDMNLKTIPHIKNTFDLPVGLSDHSLGSLSAIIGVSLGAQVIEKHFCISREYKTPDSSFSMESEEFKQMVIDIRKTEKALGKISFELNEGEKLNRTYRKSIYISENVDEGELFTEKNVRVIRPGLGLHSRYFETILGKKSAKKIEKGTPFKWEFIQ